MYEANLKAIRDRVSELQTAEARGEMLGKIRSLQSILSQKSVPSSSLPWICSNLRRCLISFSLKRALATVAVE
jgi:hypothetical protein